MVIRELLNILMAFGIYSIFSHSSIFGVMKGNREMSLLYIMLMTASFRALEITLSLKTRPSIYPWPVCCGILVYSISIGTVAPWCIVLAAVLFLVPLVMSFIARGGTRTAAMLVRYLGRAAVIAMVSLWFVNNMSFDVDAWMKEKDREVEEASAAAEAAKPAPPEFPLKAMQQFFSDSSVFASAGESEILEVCYEAVQYEFKKLGMEGDLPTIVLERIEDSTLGSYECSENRLVLNSLHVRSEGSRRVLQTLLHEVRHAYQHQMSLVYESLTPEQRKLNFLNEAGTYYENFQNYQSARNPTLYSEQPVERDARDYAEKRIVELEEELKVNLAVEKP